MKATGAKYAGMAVVHHDGFLLWDSAVNRWNGKNMGPKRDCYGEYVAALRAEGLKTIAVSGVVIGYSTLYFVKWPMSH